MKKRGKQKEEIQQETVPIEKVDKSIISPEEVGEVISGDEVALAEQMERTKVLTKEQQEEALRNAAKIAEEQKAKEEAKIREEARIQEEVRKRIDAREAAELKVQEETRKAAELKAQEETRKAAELKAQEEAKKAAELKAQEETRKAAELKAQEEARKAAELKAQEEAKKTAELEKQKQAATSSNPQPNNQKKEKEDGPSTFKRVMAVFLFLGFFAMVYFLPEISTMISNYQKSRQPKEVITDGVSTCKLSRTSENLDINTVAKFSIINSKLYKLEYITTTIGDKVEDEEELKKLKENCENLKLKVGELNGVTISCSLNNGINTTKQKLDFEKVNFEEVSTAYVESGGVYPEFKKNDNIDKIESKMRTSGYECIRE